MFFARPLSSYSRMIFGQISRPPRVLYGFLLPRSSYSKTVALLVYFAKAVYCNCLIDWLHLDSSTSFNFTSHQTFIGIKIFRLCRSPFEIDFFSLRLSFFKINLILNSLLIILSQVQSLKCLYDAHGMQEWISPYCLICTGTITAFCNYWLFTSSNFYMFVNAIHTTKT